MNVLILFSDPPNHPKRPKLRLDKEDRAFSKLATTFESRVTIDRYHATELDDIHDILARKHYDVVQFSGHGALEGIYLDKGDLSTQSEEFVSTERLVSLMDLMEPTPALVVLMCCYAGNTVGAISRAAPFVITTSCEVSDTECIHFVRGFYSHLFTGHSIAHSFRRAINLLIGKGLRSTAFELSRRSLILKADSIYVESSPDPKRDSILVNLDAVKAQLDSFGVRREELIYMLSRKLKIHRWIFDSPRENALIPIGKLMFGEFSWADSRDVVFCNRIIKLSANVPPKQWSAWSRLLVSYNDLASAEYRSLRGPSGPGDRTWLERSVYLFRHHAEKFIMPLQVELQALKMGALSPHIAMFETEIEHAEDALSNSRFPQVVSSLELALTNLHELVVALQPG